MNVMPLPNVGDSAGSAWRWPINAQHYDTRPAISVAEQDAIGSLGVDNLRRLPIASC